METFYAQEMTFALIAKEKEKRTAIPELQIIGT
jgi:hypothetical protein